MPQIIAVARNTYKSDQIRQKFREFEFNGVEKDYQENSSKPHQRVKKGESQRGRKQSSCFSGHDLIAKNRE